MTDTELQHVTPRDSTQQSLEEHYAIEHGDPDSSDFDVEASILHHEGNTLEPMFECPECQYSVTEVYLLRYVERLSDGQRFSRGESSTCTCEKSLQEGTHFIEDRRYKSSGSTAVATSHCDWCDIQYKDVYKFQTTR